MQAQQQLSTLYSMPLRPVESENFKMQQKLRLQTNKYAINFIQKQNTQIICKYDIAFEPPIEKDSRVVINQKIKLFSIEIQKELGKFLQSGSTLFAPRDVQTQIIKEMQDPSNKQKLQLMLKQVGKFSLNQSNSLAQLSKDEQQYFNILLKSCMRKMNLNCHGKTPIFYDPKLEQLIFDDSKLKIQKGYFTSFTNSQSGIRLILDYTTCLLRNDNVLLHIRNYLKEGCPQAKILEKLVGQCVLANYGNQQKYFLESIDFQKTPQNKDIDRNGKLYNYIEYYKEQYNITIQDQNQPLLIVKDRRLKQYMSLIPELCLMTGIDDHMRKNFNIMKQITQYNQISPADRLKKESDQIKKFNEQLAQISNIQISNQNDIESYQLVFPQIKMGQNKRFVAEYGSFGNNIKENQLFQVSNFKNWVVIYYASKNNREHQEDYNATGNFVNALTKVGQSLLGGNKLQEPTYIEVNSTIPQEYVEKLDFEIIRLKLTPSIIVSIIDNINSENVYQTIKQYCIEQLDKPHQNVKLRNIKKFSQSKNLLSLATNVMIQMNVKTGNAGWIVELPPEIRNERAMIVGADVYHSKQKNKRQSIVGFTATMDKYFSKFFHKVHPQQDKKEIMKNIGNLMKEGINEYFKFNKYLPELIMFYRDGVGEGQFNQVKADEITSIYNCFKEIAIQHKLNSYEPKFAEIIVCKRINEKFYSRSQNGIINPPPGTLVAKDVCQNYFDFYLIAQNTKFGTATPTHYIVLENTTKFDANVFYQMTNNLCYNYYNCQGSVKIPAVVKYADENAYFYGLYLNKEPVSQKFNPYFL